MGKAARVLCLTGDFDNEVMWGTYADNHQGYVLGFTAASVDSPFHEARPVAYSVDAPIVGSGLDFLLYGDSPELRKRTVEAVCYTKKQSWSYELEWRLITWRHGEVDALYGDYIFHPEELMSATFGVRAKHELIQSVRTIAQKQYPDLAFYRMTHHNGELRREPIA
ncbi:DUF2971 domain-containing protein [Pusillimonas sp.]|uniref:DUF2971 domain-containing protein n=1 Tax=Pusillimonas sp. TaxID=3040095 RepID=UPI0037C56587